MDPFLLSGSAAKGALLFGPGRRDKRTRTRQDPNYNHQGTIYSSNQLNYIITFLRAQVKHCYLEVAGIPRGLGKWRQEALVKQVTGNS
jgi:hypothetical protein